MEETVEVTLDYINDEGDHIRYTTKLTWRALGDLIATMDNLTETE